MTNPLYYGDNLNVLRDRVASESVDLVYLDPPLPTKPMETEAAAVGRFHSEATAKSYRRLQILTLAELFQGKKPDMPLVDPTAGIKRAGREETGQQRRCFRCGAMAAYGRLIALITFVPRLLRCRVLLRILAQRFVLVVAVAEGAVVVAPLIAFFVRLDQFAFGHNIPPVGSALTRQIHDLFQIVFLQPPRRDMLRAGPPTGRALDIVRADFGFPAHLRVSVNLVSTYAPISAFPLTRSRA